MTVSCRDCKHFEPKGLVIERDTWGLCHKTGVKLGVFRWGDNNCCTDFKVREEAKNLQNLKSQTIK